MRVTVIRQVPPLVIGSCGVVHDRDFDDFEGRLDALEASGIAVERFEPADAGGASGERSLPLVLVNGEIVASGRYPSHAEWAHALGAGRRAEEPELIR